MKIIKTNNKCNLSNSEFTKKVTYNYNRYSNYWEKPKIFVEKKQQTNLIYFDDTVQEIGAFKIRGATSGIFNVLKKNKNIKEIVSASSGSFGISVANICQKLKIKSKIFVPKNTPKLKIKKILKYKANIDDCNSDYDNCKTNAKNYSKKNSQIFYFDGCRSDIFWGNGSVVLELINYLLKIDKKILEKKILMILPLGVGSLATPSSILIKENFKNSKIMISESFNYCKFFSIYNKTIFPSFKDSIAEGTAVKKLPFLSQKYLKKTVDYIATLTENEICEGIRYLYKKYNIVAEGAGAIPTATFISNQKFFQSFDYVFIPICGNNINRSIFNKIIFNKK